ncbi:MAG: hypothetical protein MJZ20_03805 [Bacteroidaceae bacterium]|nr:hypothetical protein [Bacteroidaceae bacterium]
MGIYKDLAEGGLYTMPFLLHIYDEESDVFLINDNASLTVDNDTYRAASFEYSPNANGDASLEISLIDNVEIQNISARSRQFNCDLVGIYRGGEVVKMGTYKHKYGDATWDGSKFKIKLNADDRGNMTFPALIYNSYNNRGAQ